jgi:uncharacterized protein YgiM (DUF1202 family)
VRAGPGVNYEVVTGVFQNDELIVLGKSTDGAWIKIITPKGIRGWVFGDLVALADPSQALPVASIDATPTPGPPATQVP